MNDDEKEELGQFLSNFAYIEPIKRRFYLDNSKYKYLKLTNFNDNEYAAILDTSNKIMYHTHRGTVNSNDVKTDFQLALNNLHNTDRYNRTKNKVQKSMQLFSDYSHTHIGHSLGGSIAQKLAVLYNHSSISINRGSTPFEEKQILNSQQHIHFRDSNDFVSKFVKDNVTKSRKRKDGNFIEKSHLKFTSPILHKLYSTYRAHLLN